MSLRAKHERQLFANLEDTSKHAVVVKFDLSNPNLKWFDKVGTVATPVFSLCVLTNIVSRQEMSLSGVGVTTTRSSVHMRISTMQDRVIGIPSEGIFITACDAEGDRNFIVEKGGTLVDNDLGAITYLLTDLRDI